MTGEGPIISQWSYSNCLRTDVRQAPYSLASYYAHLLVGVGIIAAAFSTAAAWRAAAVYAFAWVLAGKRPASDRRVLGMVALLTALSLALLHTVEPDLAERQLVWLFSGACLYALVRPGIVSWLVQYRHWVAGISFLALLITAVMGKSVGGARSWLSVGPFAFQPVEFVKVFLVLYWAPLLAVVPRRRSRAYVPGLILTLSVLGVLAMQRDFGPALIILVVGLLWARSAGIPRRYVTCAALGIGTVGLFVVHSYPHLSRRIVAWLTPWWDPFGTGYQSLQARFAMAHGHVSGHGWHESFTRVPAVATDLPLVGLVERLGLLGGLVLLLLFAGTVAVMLRAAWSRHDHVERHIGIGCALLLGVEAFLAGSGAVGLTPLIGITLPFVSYGGSSLLAGFLLLALAHTWARPQERTNLAVTAPGRGLLWVASAAVVIGLPLAYWTVIAGPELVLHPVFLAQRTAAAAQHRGGIVSRNGEILTAALHEGLRQPVLPSLIHTVGYVHPQYGTAGLERTLSAPLTGKVQGATSRWRALSEAAPYRVHTSVDLGLQDVVEQALGAQSGAVVVLDPWSGAVRAMASSPRPSAGQVTASDLVDARAPLLNRATQGLYPPGSAFKVVVLAAALEYGFVTGGTRWDDDGMTVIDGYRIRNAGGRSLGRLSPVEALAASSNVVFAQLAVALGEGPLRLQSFAFGIGEQPGLEIPYRSGNLGDLGSSVHLAAAGIGQGEVLVTPLEMALVAAAVANGGYRVYPRFVTHITMGERVHEQQRQMPERAISPSTAELLRAGMRLAVAEGTFAGHVDPALLAGKTGTAENPQGEPHAWFIGFAPAIQPVVAFAVLVEHGGSGARGAGPIAQRIAEYVASGALAVNDL